MCAYGAHNKNYPFFLFSFLKHCPCSWVLCVNIMSCCELGCEDALASCCCRRYSLTHSCPPSHSLLFALCPRPCARVDNFLAFLSNPSWVNPGWQFNGPKTWEYGVYRERTEIYTQLTEGWAIEKEVKRTGDNVSGMCEVCQSLLWVCSQS